MHKNLNKTSKKKIKKGHKVLHKSICQILQR